MKYIYIILIITFPHLCFSNMSISLSNPLPNVIEVYYVPSRDYNAFPVNIWNSTEFAISYPNSLTVSSSTNSLFNLVKDGAAIANGAVLTQSFLSSNTNITLNFTNGISVKVLTLTFSSNVTLSTVTRSGGYIENASLGDQFSEGPLPITLSSFSATKHSDRASKLDWTTSSEINSAYFGIERSRDGDDWETIAKVNAAGNSNEGLAYEYIDDQLPFTRSKDNIFYYRIRLTDQDGTHKYSDIKGVNFSREVADGLISIYPNPATQMVHLDVSGLELDNVETKLNIFDMYGRSMLQKAITGSGLEPIDVQNYPAGVYNIAVTQGDKLHQKQFIKID